nr:hypothetical protein Iba_chr11bCG8460 [Ipomoea batatas]
MEMDEQPMGRVKIKRPRDGGGPSAMEMVAEGVTGGEWEEEDGRIGRRLREASGGVRIAKATDEGPHSVERARRSPATRLSSNGSAPPHGCGAAASCMGEAPTPQRPCRQRLLLNAHRHHDSLGIDVAAEIFPSISSIFNFQPRLLPRRPSSAPARFQFSPLSRRLDFSPLVHILQLWRPSVIRPAVVIDSRLLKVTPVNPVGSWTGQGNWVDGLGVGVLIK